MSAELSPCGTYGAYQRHKRRDEEPCQPCKDANAAHQRAHRKTRPDLYARALAAQHAKERAWVRLAREYPERYAELLNEERLKVYKPDAA